MADERPTGGEAPKSKKKLILIILIALVVLAGGGASALFLLGSDDSATVDELNDPVAEGLPEQASYVNISQPFLFSVAEKKRDRLVQIKVQLMVRGVANEELARHHSPLIESIILSTLGAATADQLKSPQGRSQLKEQATENIQASMTELIGKPVVEQVLFTDFVIQ